MIIVFIFTNFSYSNAENAVTFNPKQTIWSSSLYSKQGDWVIYQTRGDENGQCLAARYLAIDGLDRWILILVNRNGQFQIGIGADIDGSENLLKYWNKKNVFISFNKVIANGSETKIYYGETDSIDNNVVIFYILQEFALKGNKVKELQYEHGSEGNAFSQFDQLFVQTEDELQEFKLPLNGTAATSLKLSECMERHPTQQFSGVISHGSLDSGIGEGTFITKSTIGDAIFSVCGHENYDKPCNIVADVEGENSIISRLYTVHSENKVTNLDKEESTKDTNVSWTALERRNFGFWEYTHNQYITSGNKFCSAETRNPDGTILRLNFFNNGKVHFVELLNEQWDQFKGDIKFSMQFKDGYKIEFKGKSWGNAYTHDFLDKKNTMTFLSFLSKNSKVDVINSNNGNIGSFVLGGANAAIDTMLECAGLK